MTFRNSAKLYDAHTAGNDEVLLDYKTLSEFF